MILTLEVVVHTYLAVGGVLAGDAFFHLRYFPAKGEKPLTLREAAVLFPLLTFGWPVVLFMLWNDG